MRGLGSTKTPLIVNPKLVRGLRAKYRGLPGSKKVADMQDAERSAERMGMNWESPENSEKEKHMQAKIQTKATAQ